MTPKLPSSVSTLTSAAKMMALAGLIVSGCATHKVESGMPNSEAPSVTVCNSNAVVADLIARADLITKVCEVEDFAGWIVPGSIITEDFRRLGRSCTTATEGPKGISCPE